MEKRKIILAMAFSIALAGGIPLTASASGYCAPSVGALISQNTLNKQNRIDETVEEINARNQAQLDASNSTFSCSDVWSSPSISISFQNVVDLLKKAGEAAISKACQAARDKITAATSEASQKASLNTSNIPGLSDLGLGTIASASSGTSSTGGVTVNGTSTTWSSISSLMN